NIYICCANEPNNNENTPVCQWKLSLSETESSWRLKRVANREASEHNHKLDVDDSEPWDPTVKEKVVQLIRQKMPSVSIRETIQSQFPEITWNDRRFYSYLKDENKRIHQRRITERVQRLILASTRLCSVVAANEDWSSCVENDLSKLLENYKHKTRLSNQALENSVDLPLDMIHSEIDKSRAKKQQQEDQVPTKKRKVSAPTPSDAQLMSIPSCTLYIRSQPLRSLSEPSTQNRRAFTDLLSSNMMREGGGGGATAGPFGVSSVFTLSSPVSSPSSSLSSIQQRMDYTNYRNHDSMMQSPPIPDNIMTHFPTSYHPTMQQQTSFAPYPPPPSNMPSSTDLSFPFEHAPNGSFQAMSPSPMVVRENYVNYYSSPLRDSSSIPQRMMMQEYDQRSQDPNQLPMIRSNPTMPPNTMNQNDHNWP
ncbi:hypothetical protein K501DRAFT_315795, partial [Backusella circina FSU 941]